MALTIDPTAKLKIISLDDSGGTFVEAQFNPKELQIDKSVPWSKHKSSKDESPDMEFTGAEPMTMSLELLFDGAESGTSVQTEVDKLIKLASIIDFNVVAKKRPHRVKVIWGSPDGAGGTSGGLMPFEGVISSVSTKYQMFSKDGVPLRATCQCKLTQANTAAFKTK